MIPFQEDFSDMIITIHIIRKLVGKGLFKCGGAMSL
jgi:hypothetical protein